MQGASPLASPGAEPMVRRKTERKRFPASGAAGVHPPGTCMAVSASAVGGSAQGCRGRRPRRTQLWDSPFPTGRGAGGWGKEIKLKARSAADLPGKLPTGLLHGGVCKCRRRFSAGVPGGEAPGEINFGTPPSPEGEGGGGMGERNKAKGRTSRRPAGQAPPPGARNAGAARAAFGSGAGMQGAKPLA